MTQPDRFPPIKVFISHAEKDQRIAETLIKYLHAEFGLLKQDIRCTSVPGYMLPPGEFIASRLRDDVDKSVGFITLLSYFSLQSTWVKFELGAAWVKRKEVIPILGPDVDFSDPRLGPISQIPRVSVDDSQCEAKLRQYMGHMASSLGIEMKPKSRKLKEFIEIYRKWGGDHADFSATHATIIQPHSGTAVGRNISTQISLSKVPSNGFVWLAVQDAAVRLLWPKEQLIKPQRDGDHFIEIVEGGSPTAGKMGVWVLGVGPAGNAKCESWRETAENTGNWKGISEREIPGLQILACADGLTLNAQK